MFDNTQSMISSARGSCWFVETDHLNESTRYSQIVELILTPWTLKYCEHNSVNDETIIDSVLLNATLHTLTNMHLEMYYLKIVACMNKSVGDKHDDYSVKRNRGLEI